jgi:polyisoprenoid-binding protein YceI
VGLTPMARFARRRNAFLLWFAVSCAWALAPAAFAQDLTIDLDPAATKVDFTLAATLHTVHGTLKLKSGRIRFDPSTGKMSGAIVVDATSADTGNASRDAKMHGEILESKQFPEIVFTPNQAKGPLLELLNQQKPMQVQVSGVFRLHGQDHDATLMMSVAAGAAGRMDISGQFSVPYVKWGLKNPSTLVLRVGDTVDLEVQTRGKIVVSP